MADSTLANLTADASPTGDDLIYVLNDPAGTPADRKVTLTNLAVFVLASDADLLKADTADVLTAGFATTPFNAGTKSSGTYTPDEASGNFQYAVNGGGRQPAPPPHQTNNLLPKTNKTQ